MLRLTLLLSGGMLLALIIWGEDNGQLRPGLAKASADAERAALAPPATVAPEPEPPAFLAAHEASAAPPPVVADTEAPEPYVEPVRETVVAVDEPVFSLANVGNEAVPGEETGTLPPDIANAPPALDREPEALEVPATVADAPPETQALPEPSGGALWYVTASSVNLRAEPSTEAEILTKLGQGDAAVLIAEVDAEWAQIVLQDDGLVGYVAFRYLTQVVP